MNTLNCKGRLISLESPKVMGILNVTPDSFYDGGKFDGLDSAVQQVGKMIAEGVDIIDIGGMSSRPGAEIIEPQIEKSRVVPIIKAIKESFPEIVVSIDTVQGSVAQSAIDAGASIINDIAGGTVDQEIWDVAIQNKVPYILMHMQGRPNTMQLNPEYTNVVLDILGYLKDKVYALREKGLTDIVIDPGFGFGKTVAQNYTLLDRLSAFKILDCPILVGLSRKSMIYKVLDTTPKGAMNGTTALHMIALQRGAKILRVHDVKNAVECVKLFKELKAVK
ncbi:MAG: dihydropteroate synthase [Saprospiraceae bacterium]|nr:dihydropteroate synthase [Saprospiraceae bacterium]